MDEEVRNEMEQLDTELDDPDLDEFRSKPEGRRWGRIIAALVGVAVVAFVVVWVAHMVSSKENNDNTSTATTSAPNTWNTWTPPTTSPETDPPTSHSPTPSPPTDAPSTVSPPTDPPATDPPATPSPPTPAPPTDAPPTPSPPTPAPPTEAPPTEAPPLIEEMRLVGGVAANEGRIEVKHEGVWGTVCSDRWNQRAARVVCRQMGYAGATAAPHRAYFGAGSGPIHLDDVECRGDEETLAQCRHKAAGDHDCTHAQDAGVICTPSHAEAACICPFAPLQFSIDVVSYVAMCSFANATLELTMEKLDDGHFENDPIHTIVLATAHHSDVRPGDVFHFNLPSGFKSYYGNRGVFVNFVVAETKDSFGVALAGEGDLMCNVAVPEGAFMGEGSGKYVGVLEGSVQTLLFSVLAERHWVFDDAARFPPFTGSVVVLQREVPATPIPPPPTPAPTLPPHCEGAIYIENAYLHTYAMGDEMWFTEAEALARCKEYNWACKGYTCTSRNRCNLRETAKFTVSPSGEFSCLMNDIEELAKNKPESCVKWRGRSCSGGRTAQNDAECDAPIPADGAGWCQCGLRFLKLDCRSDAASYGTCTQLCTNVTFDECIHDNPCGDSVCHDVDTSPLDLHNVRCSCAYGNLDNMNSAPNCSDAYMAVDIDQGCPLTVFPIDTAAECLTAAKYFDSANEDSNMTEVVDAPSGGCAVQRNSVVYTPAVYPQEADGQEVQNVSNGSYLVCTENRQKGGFTPPPDDYSDSSEGMQGAVLGLINRTLGADTADRFEVRITKDSQRSACSVDISENQTVVITANSGLSAARCFYSILERHNMSVAWGRDRTGYTVDSEHTFTPSSYSLQTRVAYRYAYNTCTFSYTMAWWDWERWSQEIDWLALRGVNLPLAFVGQEYVWKKLYTEFNVSEEDIWEHFTGVAFLAWGRMGNVEGWGGPLTDEYLVSRHELQKQILARMRSFGMTPVLPAFAGHVPNGLQKLHPTEQYTRSQSWNGFPSTTLLQPTSPLFKSIGTRFIELQKESYGGLSHFYNGDTFNEMDPEQSGADYLAASGRAVVDAIHGGDAHGKWLVQGWTFTLGWWSPNAYERVGHYLGGVSEKDVLVLDLSSETRPLYGLTNDYFRHSFVWCLLHNFGGRPGTYGNAKKILTGGLEQMFSPSSTAIGAGITMEASGQNPIVYDLAFDLSWEGIDLDSAADLYDWERRWVGARYGFGHGSDAEGKVHAAWAVFTTTVYEYDNDPGTGKWAIFSEPSVHRTCECHFCHPGDSVFSAWSTFLDAADDVTVSATETYKRDLAQFTAFVVHSKACLVLNALSATNQVTQRIAALKELEDVMTLLDAVFDTDVNTQLACWVHDAKKWGASEEETHRVVTGALAQVTVWTPYEKLNDYAKKGWSGLTRDYYIPRWRLLRESLENNTISTVRAFEKTWYKEFNYTDYICEPRGDIVALAHQVKSAYWGDLSE